MKCEDTKASDFIPVNIALSPRPKPLEKNNGDIPKTRKLNKVQSGAAVQVEYNKRKYWGQLSSLFRELAQNISDACIRTYATDDPDNFVARWSTEITPNGALLHLNDKIAGEWMWLVSKGREIHLIFFNYGLALIQDAFMPGSHKGKNLGSKKHFIAGGHGLGLKDVISVAFDEHCSNFTQMSAVSYHPRAIRYHDDKKRLFRYFVMHKDKSKKSRCFEHFQGNYTLDISDTGNPPKRLPCCVQKLLTNIKNHDRGGVPATVFVFTRAATSPEAVEAEIEHIKQASMKHIFLCSSKEFRRIEVKSSQNNSFSSILIHKRRQESFKVFLYPGLFLCAKKSNYEDDNLLSFVFSAGLVVTNRDRVLDYNDMLSANVGDIIVTAMKSELFSELNDTTDDDVLESQCPISLLVSRAIHRDLDLPDDGKMSVVSKAIVDYVSQMKTSHESSSVQFIKAFFCKKLFGKFEIVLKKSDRAVVNALREVRQIHDSSINGITVKLYREPCLDHKYLPKNYSMDRPFCRFLHVWSFFVPFALMIWFGSLVRANFQPCTVFGMK